MTASKVALANVGMWVRDHYFRGASTLMPVGIAARADFLGNRQG
jgi:hypothetical protein